MATSEKPETTSLKNKTLITIVYYDAEGKEKGEPLKLLFPYTVEVSFRPARRKPAPKAAPKSPKTTTTSKKKPTPKKTKK